LLMQVDRTNFDEQVTGSDVPVLVQFTADWCQTCKAMRPLLRELSEELAGRLKVGTMDAAAEGTLAARYGVMSLPTVVVFREGEAVGRIVGSKSRRALRDIVNECLEL